MRSGSMSTRPISRSTTASRAGLRVLGIAEHGRAAAIFQQLGELVGVQRGVERDYRASRRNNPEIGCHPSGMVIRHDGQPRSPRESLFGDPSSDRFSHAAKFGVGATLDAIIALELQCDVVRPALRAFEKTVVESGHESCGIYTKNQLVAVSAETTEWPGQYPIWFSALSASSAVNNLYHLFPVTVPCI